MINCKANNFSIRLGGKGKIYGGWGEPEGAEGLGLCLYLTKVKMNAPFFSFNY